MAFISDIGAQFFRFHNRYDVRFFARTFDTTAQCPTLTLHYPTWHTSTPVHHNVTYIFICNTTDTSRQDSLPLLLAASLSYHVYIACCIRPGPYGQKSHSNTILYFGVDGLSFYILILGKYLCVRSSFVNRLCALCCLPTTSRTSVCLDVCVCTGVPVYADVFAQELNVLNPTKDPALSPLLAGEEICNNNVPMVKLPQ